jgi:hypothetical protein
VGESGQTAESSHAHIRDVAAAGEVKRRERSHAAHCPSCLVEILLQPQRSRGTSRDIQLTARTPASVSLSHQRRLREGGWRVRAGIQQPADPLEAGGEDS